MAPETDFPLTAADLRKRVAQLRHLIDQGEVDDEKLLDTVFDDELDWIDDHLPKLHSALVRIEADYSKLTDASTELEASQDAADAMVQLLAAEERDEDDDDDDGVVDPDADLDGDPDADLDERG